jgi:hypothetical protein
MIREVERLGEDQEEGSTQEPMLPPSGLSRRDFLRAALTVAAGAAVGGALFERLSSAGTRVLYLSRTINRDGNSITHELADFTRHEFYRLPDRETPFWWCEMRGADGTFSVGGVVVPSGSVFDATECPVICGS